MANLLYDQTSDGAAKVIRADLSSSGDLDSGTRTPTSSPSGTPATFDPYVPNGDEYIKWSPAGFQESALETLAHVHWEVEKEFLENLTGGTENRMITLGAGSDKATAKTSTVDINLGGIQSAVYTYLNLTNRAQDYVVFDVHLTPTTQKVFVDNVELTDIGANAADFATINMGASQSGTNPWQDSPMADSGFKNIYVYSELQLGTAGTIELMQYGDSQVRRGGWPSLFSIQNGQQNGVTNGGDGVTAYRDQGASATIARELANLGYNVNFTSEATDGASVQGTRVSGGGDPDDLITQIGLGPQDLSGMIVEVGCGTNDISGGPLQAGWQAILQGRIDSIVALGPQSIFMSTVATRALSSEAGAKAWFESSIDEMNDAIRAVAANTPNMYVFDTFTALGGHSAPQLYFETPDTVPHFTLDGQRVVGETFVSTFLISGSAPDITTAYPDRTYLIGDSVSIDCNTNITGETSLTVSPSGDYQGGLSETGGIISGTVIETTGTINVTVTGTNSFGSVSDTFQLTTLTTGAPSTGINVPINE